MYKRQEEGSGTLTIHSEKAQALFDRLFATPQQDVATRKNDETFTYDVVQMARDCNLLLSAVADMSREELLQYAVTTAEENRLLRMTCLSQNTPGRAKLRERQKMGGAKTGEEARAAIVAKQTATKAAEEEKKRKEASRKRKREDNVIRKEKMKRLREEEKGRREAEKEEKRREKEEKALLKSRAMVKREAERKARAQQKKMLKAHQAGRKRRIVRQAKERKEGCQICRKGDKRGTEYAKCTACTGRYHIACLRKGTQPYERGQRWICFACMNPI